MAATSTHDTHDTPTPVFELPSVDEAGKRIRALNERFVESSKSSGLVALDAYEKALNGLVDFESKVASASQVEWVSAVARTHSRFVADLSSSYTTAARDLLT